MRGDGDIDMDDGMSDACFDDAVLDAAFEEAMAADAGPDAFTEQMAPSDLAPDGECDHNPLEEGLLPRWAGVGSKRATHKL